MPQDGVYWSSRIENFLFWWNWKVTIYNGENRVIKYGWAISQKSAAEKRNRWLRSMGELP